MQKISSITDTADANGEFTDGSGASAVQSTLLPAAWFNTIQREMVAVVEGAGLKLNPSNDQQLLAALKKLFPVLDDFGSATTASGQWDILPNGTLRQTGTATLTAVGSYNVATVGDTTFYTHFYRVAYPRAFPNGPISLQVTLQCPVWKQQVSLLGKTLMATPYSNTDGTISTTQFAVAYTTPVLGETPTFYFSAVGN